MRVKLGAAFYLHCYNNVNVFESSFPKLLKLIKYPKLPIFSRLENNRFTFFTYIVITLLIKWGYNEAQTQQQKDLQCYNTVNVLQVVKRLSARLFGKGY